MKKVLVGVIAACAMSLAVAATNAGPAGSSILGAGLTNAQSSNSGVVLIKKRHGAGHHRPHHRPHRHRRRARAVAAGVAAGVAIGAAATASHRNYCGRLAYRCNRGDLPACAEHDINCLF